MQNKTDKFQIEKPKLQVNNDQVIQIIIILSFNERCLVVYQMCATPTHFFLD